MTTYFAILPERNGAANDICFNSMIDVAMMAGVSGCKRIALNYTSTDKARNAIVEKFMAAATEPDDLLIMLDSDHIYPANIIGEFMRHDKSCGVVGALAYRRGEPYDPLFFLRQNGGLCTPVDFERGPLYACQVVSTSAISIRRWVFDKLAELGYKTPYFRYSYSEEPGKSQPSEDMYFGSICEQAGIDHFCDTSIVIPHAIHAFVDAAMNAAYNADHPQETMAYIASEKVLESA